MVRENVSKVDVTEWDIIQVKVKYDIVLGDPGKEKIQDSLRKNRLLAEN